ncbi:hypothetical protein EXU48_15715 [Occultella glacieicola]|uniref:Uncharacterized protein n=1 Tax=Occultella glacieicola TaxID=2518684 RepID=A0ABY2E252_9MICO|nr:hypothetical protein [Occultella glacieicola]TDE91591.1 hypothetical protein EXU48_15715 [Occultella glacieicola]
MPSTPAGLPYPSGNDQPNVPYDVQQLAEALDPMVNDTGWVPIDVYAGYETKSGTPAVRRIGPVVYARGVIGPTAGTMAASQTVYIGRVPVGFRVAESLWFAAGTTAGQPAATLVQLSDGQIQARTPNLAVSYVGLSSMSYPVD